MNNPNALTPVMVAFELVADLVGHEADLLPLNQLAFRVGGSPLPFRV
jgi:hypothetical protein